MNTSSRHSVRTIAAATALGMALATGTIGAGIAHAEPATISNIDFAERGSLTIHKRDLGASTPAEPTGNEDLTAPGTVLPGATFTLYPVTGVDLTTNAGFNAAAALTPETAAPRIGTEIRSDTSDAAGLIEFAELPVGVYLLRETGSPAGYSPAADSIVFIPMTNPTDTTKWNYDVHVYPKNSKNEVIKKVNDANQQVGGTITYTIDSDIPRVVERDNEVTTITKYEVYDNLDETRLGAPAITVGLTTGATYVQGVDYTVEPLGAGLEVNITFTPEGRAKLTAAKAVDPTVKVRTTLASEVLAMGDTSVIINDAKTITNNGGGGGDTTTISKPVESYYGKLQVLKYEEDTPGKPLAGAIFQLYVCTGQNNLVGQALTVGGQSTWPTNAQGTFTINALHVTDFADGAEITATQKYCLVETTAPAGYELLPNPIPIDFKRADIAATDDGTDAVTLRAEVENVKTIAPELPLTGGAGIGILAALGGLIVAGGAWVARRMNRA